MMIQHDCIGNTRHWPIGERQTYWLGIIVLMIFAGQQYLLSHPLSVTFGSVGNSTDITIDTIPSAEEVMLTPLINDGSIGRSSCN